MLLFLKNGSSFCHSSAPVPSAAPTARSSLWPATESSPLGGSQHLPSTHPPALTFAQLPVIFYLPHLLLKLPVTFLLPFLPVRMLPPSFQINATSLMKILLAPSPPVSKQIHTRYDLACLESPLRFALFWKWHTLSRMRASCELAITTNTRQRHSKLPFL